MEIERERVITSNRNIDTRLLITPSFNMWEIEEGRRKGKKKDEEKEKEKKRKEKRLEEEVLCFLQKKQELVF